MGYAESKALNCRHKALLKACSIGQRSRSAYPCTRHKRGYADLGIASLLRPTHRRCRLGPHLAGPRHSNRRRYHHPRSPPPF
jgi:hypothetical protein